MKLTLIEYNPITRDLGELGEPRKYIAVVDDVKYPERYYHFLDSSGVIHGNMNFIYGDKFKNLTMEDYFAFSNAILHMGKGKYNIRKITNEIQNNRI